MSFQPMWKSQASSRKVRTCSSLQPGHDVQTWDWPGRPCPRRSESRSPSTPSLLDSEITSNKNGFLGPMTVWWSPSSVHPCTMSWQRVPLQGLGADHWIPRGAYFWFTKKKFQQLSQTQNLFSQHVKEREFLFGFGYGKNSWERKNIEKNGLNDLISESYMATIDMGWLTWSLNLTLLLLIWSDWLDLWSDWLDLWI